MQLWHSNRPVCFHKVHAVHSRQSLHGNENSRDQSQHVQRFIHLVVKPVASFNDEEFLELQVAFGVFDQVLKGLTVGRSLEEARRREPQETSSLQESHLHGP